MDSIVLAARLHNMDGAREDLIKAIETWHMSKARIGGKTAFTDDMREREARAAQVAEETAPAREAAAAERRNAAFAEDRERARPQHEAKLARVD